MRRGPFYGTVTFTALVLAVLFTAGGCRRGDSDASAADRDSRRGGVSPAPLPPRTPSVDSTTGPAGGPSTSPGPATAPEGAEMPGGVRGHTFVGFEDAKSVVFVCVGTGTMINRFGVLTAEVVEALARLKPEQSFNVFIFFDGPKVTAVDSDMLLPATDANKRRARKLLENFTTTGQNDPIPALRLALKLEPEVLFYVSDGEFSSLYGYKEVADAIAKANPGNRTRVNTVLFAPPDGQAEESLKQIARRHGGTYRAVSQELTE